MLNPLSRFEFIALIAMVFSIGAAAVDIMLPALDVIGEDLGAPAANDVHYIVTAFYLGMAGGQLVVGPLSDTFGRKPVILCGYGVFIFGCLLSMVTESWAVMLFARVLQGLGAAAPRIVVVALVRDEFEGRAMARIMSSVMALFIIVPIIAPALGQGLIYLAGWVATFAALAGLAVMVSVWFALRQPETLPPAKRRAFRAGTIWTGIREIFGHRTSVGYTVASGLIVGMFVGYLGTSQQVFQGTFGVGEMFVVYFAVGSAAIGSASLLNAGLVMRFGMQRLTVLSVGALAVLSLGFWALLPAFGGVPPLALFMVWQVGALFCFGVMFGNLNALALEPLGHLAGLGAAFVGSVSIFISLPLAAAIGRLYDGTVVPLVGGFAILGTATLVVILLTGRGGRVGP